MSSIQNVLLYELYFKDPAFEFFLSKIFIFVGSTKKMHPRTSPTAKYFPSELQSTALISFSNGGEHLTKVF